MKESESIRSSFVEPTKFIGKIRIYRLDGEIDFEQTAVIRVDGGGTGGCSGYPPCGGAPIDFPGAGCCSADNDGRPPQFDDADNQGGWCGEVPCDDSGGGTNYTSYERCIYYGDCDEFVTFDDSFTNNNKADCVYDHLNSVCGNLFNQTIGQFQDDPTLHLNFSLSNDCPQGASACISQLNSDNTIQIKINPNHVSSSTVLRLASTILHESIHANIEAYLWNHHDLLNEDREHTERLLQLYKYYKSLESPDYSDNWPDHTFMAEFYINPIAEALWEFNDNQLSVEHYKAFAWDGLIEYDGTSPHISQDELQDLQDLAQEVNQNLIECE